MNGLSFGGNAPNPIAAPAAAASTEPCNLASVSRSRCADACRELRDVSTASMFDCEGYVLQVSLSFDKVESKVCETAYFSPANASAEETC